MSQQADALNQVGVQSELTVNDTAGGLTIPSGQTPAHLLLHVNGAAIRWRADGTAPTTSAGMPQGDGTYLDWTDPRIDYRGMITKLSLIRDDAVDAVINVAFFD